MKCYYHTNQDVVATCTECGKGLCRACADKWEPILCDDCAAERIQQKRAKLKRSIVLGVLIFSVGIIIGIITAVQHGRIDYILEGIFMGYVLGGVPNGWISLTKVQPNMFLFLSWAGWLLYFFIKFLISIVIGLFAFPVNLYRYWKGNKEASEMEKQIK